MSKKSDDNKPSITEEQADEMILSLVARLDYDLAKTFDPDCSEEPEEIPERLAELREIIAEYIDIDN